MLKKVREQLKWTHSDMLVMKEYSDDSAFDCVIDKATMDVIMTDNEDPWNPNPEILERSNKILLLEWKHILDILV